MCSSSPHNERIANRNTICNVTNTVHGNENGIANLDESENNEWCIYGGVKGLCTFISIVLYSVVCKYYHYRERDEVVNEQAIIDLFEQELMYETEDSQSTHSS